MGVAFIVNGSLHCYIFAEDFGTVGYPAQLQIMAAQVFVQRLFQNQNKVLKIIMCALHDFLVVLRQSLK